MGNQYVVERQFDEIATKLMEPPKEDEPEEEKKEEVPVAEVPVAAPTTKAPETAKPAPANAKQEKGKPEVPVPGTAEEAQEPEEPKEPEEPPFKPNDYLQKAEMEPPRDPEGECTMHADLLLLQSRIVEILQNALSQTLTWILAEKQLYE